jgi:tRNA(Ile)-lysidine synthase
VIAWRGQGPVAVSSNLPRTRLLVQRRGALLTLHREPV